MAGVLAVLGCTTDETGTAFPAADLVRFPGADVVGEVSPLEAPDVYEGSDADGYDWALASAAGTVYLGVPAVGELRQFQGGQLAGGGDVVVTGAKGERLGASVAATAEAVVVGIPEFDGGPALDGAGAVSFIDANTVIGSAAESGFGAQVALCGDLDGNGSADWAAVSPQERGFAGAVYRGELGDGAAGVSELVGLDGADSERFGGALACGGDVVGDTWDDLAIGVPFSPGSAGVDAAGRVEIWSQEAFDLAVPSRTLYGQEAGALDDERFGTSIAYCRIDGDLVDDMVVGAPGADEGAGRVYVFRGRVLRSPMHFGDVFPASTILVGPSPGAHFGEVVDCGDVSGDGVDDLFVGAPGEDAADGTREAGAIYVFAGPSTDWGEAAATDIASAIVHDDRAFLRTGNVFTVADTDQDGKADLVLVVRQRARGT